MYSLVQLVTNEWIKITKKKSFLISLILVALVTIGAAWFIKGVIGADFMSAGKFGSSFMSMSGGGFLYLVLCILTASTMVSKEHQLGTIKLLLIRAHSRTKILASKFIATLLYMIVLALYTIVVSYIVGFLFFTNTEGLMLAETFVQAGYFLIYVFAYVTIAFMCSTLLKSTGGTIGFVLSLTMIEGLIVGLLYNYKFAKYLLFFNTDFEQFSNGDLIIAELTPTFSAMIYGLYMIAFILVTFVVFKRRDVA